MANLTRKTILIAGGCGFIASHFVEHVHQKTEWNIVVVDKLSYASNGLARLRDSGILDSHRMRVFTSDLAQPLTEGLIKEIGDIHYIMHMAADTHVDNSIRDPVEVIRNNVMSTVHLLEYARRVKGLEKFFYFSTDELYGSAPANVAYKEIDRHNPTNPYSASKSAAEQICVAYENTYDIPLIMVNVMNVFGERQHVEKFIPRCIKYTLEGRKILIHADKTCTAPGSRSYIHARNIADAVMFLMQKGSLGELYHIAGEREVSNLEMAKIIADIMGRPLYYELVNFHEDRPGHDIRYALDCTKLQELGWVPPVNFEESMRNCVRWTLDNPAWLDE